MYLVFVVTRAVVGLFLEAGGPCLSESSSELGLLEKIARPLLALTLWELFNYRCNNIHHGTSCSVDSDAGKSQSLSSP